MAEIFKVRVCGSPLGNTLHREVAHANSQRLSLRSAVPGKPPLVYDGVSGAAVEADLNFKSWVHPDDLTALAALRQRGWEPRG